MVQLYLVITPPFISHFHALIVDYKPDLRDYNLDESQMNFFALGLGGCFRYGVSFAPCTSFLLGQNKTHDVEYC